MYLILCHSVAETSIMASGTWNKSAKQLFCTVFLCQDYGLTHVLQKGYLGTAPSVVLTP